MIRHIIIRKNRIHIALALLFCAMIVGCYSTGSEDPGPVASISRIEIQPEVISPTDTVRATVFISYSHQRNIVYKWRFQAWESAIIGQKIGTILNGGRADNNGFTQTDSAYVVWKPDGYVGLVSVVVSIVPRSGPYDDETSAQTFRIHPE
jgi:hypothetical protein